MSEMRSGQNRGFNAEAQRKFLIYLFFFARRLRRAKKIDFKLHGENWLPGGGEDSGETAPGENRLRSQAMKQRLPVVNKHRHVFVLRIWQHEETADAWISEVQEVKTGLTEYIYGLEALFDFLKQKITASVAVQPPDPPAIQINRRENDDD